MTAREHLRAAVRKFAALGLSAHHAAAWADLVAVEMSADRAGTVGRGEWRDRMLHQSTRPKRRGFPPPTGPYAKVPGTSTTWTEAIENGEDVPVAHLRKAAERAGQLTPALLSYPEGRD